MFAEWMESLVNVSKLNRSRCICYNLHGCFIDALKHFTEKKKHKKKQKTAELQRFSCGHFNRCTLHLSGFKWFNYSNLNALRENNCSIWCNRNFNCFECIQEHSIIHSESIRSVVLSVVFLVCQWSWLDRCSRRSYCYNCVHTIISLIRSRN